MRHLVIPDVSDLKTTLSHVHKFLKKVLYQFSNTILMKELRNVSYNVNNLVLFAYE